VAVVAVAFVVPVSLLVSMVRRVATRTGIVALSTSVRLRNFALALPASNESSVSTTRGGSRSWKSATAVVREWMCPNGTRRSAFVSLGGAAQDRGDGAHLGLNHECNLGVTRVPDQATGNLDGECG